MSQMFSPDVTEHNLHACWQDTSKEAYLYERHGTDSVRCLVCPRRCVIAKGGVGFCKVRKNIGGVLFAQSYGKATHITIERIETEAVHHYRPGSKILSLGNFGCNLDCDYCQNWQYSQFQYTAPEHIHHYSTRQIIDEAKVNGVGMLSWTYNDPAVWYEFVLDTAIEARKHGLQNLFKSAFFLTAEAVAELIKVIDVFAVSIKAMDEHYYRQFTKGWLPPVLDATRQVARSGRHFEISNLVVTGLTNNLAAYDRMIDFALSDLGPDVPLHFTRFHPDYKYTGQPKTPIEDVMQARARGIERGLRYVYIGNAFESEGLHTWCPQCHTLLIERFGLSTRVQDHLADDGRCKACGYQNPIVGVDVVRAATSHQ